WQASPDDLQQLQPLANELRNLTYGAAHAYLPPMANLGEKLQCIYQLVLAGELSVSDELCATLDKAHLALLDMVDAVAAGQNLAGAPAEIEAELAVYTSASNTNEAAETEIEFSLPQSEAWQG